MRSADTSTAVLFIGPSLDGSGPPRLFPAHVEVRPPVRRGDMDGLSATVTDVLIVDGVFHSTLAVSAREILAALRRGVRVYGSSSMGALRAAELDRFGMVGVGGVYEMYRSGEVVSDAEVAMVFDSDSFLPLSEPLVNIRYAIRCGREAGCLTPGGGAAIMEVASAFRYPDLNYESLFDVLAERVPAAEWQAWRAFVLADIQAVNLKYRDALDLASHYRSAMRHSGPPL
jgi:hypothetical protein